MEVGLSLEIIATDLSLLNVTDGSSSCFSFSSFDGLFTSEMYEFLLLLRKFKNISIVLPFIGADFCVFVELFVFGDFVDRFGIILAGFVGILIN